ncbi:ATP-binding cassette domain-containing protein [Propionibacterium australiense]|nr:ATP-binding cassette domain-containing protein [Propionibacterium australiense]
MPRGTTMGARCSGPLRTGAPVVVLLAVIVAVGAGPALAPHSITEPLGAPWGVAPGALLGTDSLGRDVWSRTLAGGVRLVQASIPIGLAITALGAVLGLLATRSARLSRLLGVVTATTMAVPGSVMVLCCAVVLPSVAAVALGMLFLGVPFSARIIRAAAGPMLDAEFLRAAERRGEGHGYIVVGELLPALSGTIIADAAIRVLAALQLLAALHVLGFGPPPPAADWAMMVRENLPGVTLAPWSVAAPAAALAGVSVTVMLCLNALSRSLAPSAAARGGRTGRLPRGGAVADELLRVRGLRLGPASEPLVRIAELTLAPGEILGVCGPSGAGKSSLAETLAGAPRPGLELSAAEFVIAGRALPRGERARARLRRRLIGWSEQDPIRTIDGRRTVIDVIADGRRLAGRVPGLLERLGLPRGLGDRPARALSGGQAVRICLARALAGEPAIIVLDEPTAGLDPDTIGVVTSALGDFAATGGGAIVISHDLPWLATVADRVIEVREGLARPVEGAPQAAADTGRSARLSSGGERLLGHWSGLSVDVEGRPSLLPWDLDLHAGEIVAVLAPSGSGKSSVLRALGGDRLPSQVRVGGEGLPGEGGVDPGQTQLMVQDSATALNPGRSLRAQVARQARVVAGLSRRDALLAAEQMLARLGLHEPVISRRPGECSGGERQRAALARALVIPAPVLLLDEPTSALDPASRARVMELLRERAQAGHGILVATHDEEAARAADRSTRPPLAQDAQDATVP